MTNGYSISHLMSVNQVILMGKLVKKKDLPAGEFKGAIETTFRNSKNEDMKSHHYVVCDGGMADRMNDIPINSDVYVEGRITNKKENGQYITEVIARYFEVPNK